MKRIGRFINRLIRNFADVVLEELEMIRHLFSSGLPFYLNASQDAERKQARFACGAVLASPGQIERHSVYAPGDEILEDLWETISCRIPRRYHCNNFLVR